MSPGVVEKGWSVDKDPDFDLQAYARNVMEGAKKCLVEDGYLQAFASLICDSEIVGYSLGFEGYEEKTRVYREVVAIAKELNAIAIVTLNDVRTATDKMVNPGEYYYGRLEEMKAPEAIVVCVSGPTIPTWKLDLPYGRADGGINFGELSVETEVMLNMLPGWTFEENRVN